MYGKTLVQLKREERVAKKLRSERMARLDAAHARWARQNGVADQISEDDRWVTVRRGRWPMY